MLNNLNQLNDFMSIREMHYNINISLKNKYVYVETPKSACTTIKKTLMNIELEGTPYKPDKVHYESFYSPFIKLFQLDNNAAIHTLNSPDFYRFTFVRNPYVRILSCYLDKILNNKNPKLNLLHRIGKTKDDLDMEIDFEYFLDIVSKQNFYEMDKHWRPQFHQLFGGIIKYNFIGRTEKLKSDLLVIEENTGLKIKKHFESFSWHNTNAKTKLNDYYTKRAKKLVSEIYKMDFIEYGYSSDLQILD